MPQNGQISNDERDPSFSESLHQGVAVIVNAIQRRESAPRLAGRVEACNFGRNPASFFARRRELHDANLLAVRLMRRQLFCWQ